MQKYIDMMSSIPNWMPFIGMMTGAATPKTPFATRMVEMVVFGMVMTAGTYVIIVTEVKKDVESNQAISQIQAAQYTAAQRETSQNIKEMSKTIKQLEINDAVTQNSIAEMKHKIDSIDQIANTKVRSVEGRIDSLERQLK